MVPLPPRTVAAIDPVVAGRTTGPLLLTRAGTQEFARHADPRTTIRYDRARHSLDRHVSCTVMPYVAGAA